MEDIRLIGKYIGYTYEADKRHDYWLVNDQKYLVIADADDRKYQNPLEVWIIT